MKSDLERLAESVGRSTKQLAEIAESVRPSVDGVVKEWIETQERIRESIDLRGFGLDCRLPVLQEEIERFSESCEISRKLAESMSTDLRFDKALFSQLAEASDPLRTVLDSVQEPLELHAPNLLGNRLCEIERILQETQARNAKPGNAVTVLAVLNESFQQKQREYEGNPRKRVCIVATLATGKQIEVGSAQNVGGENIQIGGRDIDTKRNEEVLAGVATVNFEVLVVDVEPPKPTLVKGNEEDSI